MNKLARWYNFKVEYDSPTLKKYKFGVNVNKYDSIEPVLKILGSTNKLQFVINGDIINIKEGNSE